MYSQEKADRICARLAEGESLNAICKDEDLPAESTVRAWALDDIEGFAAKYTRAREIGYERLADELLDIADDGSNDWMERHDNDGGNAGWQFNGEAARRSQIRLDTRKWMLSKMLPKKYGDKIDLNHSGGFKVSREMTEEELASIAAGSGG